MNRSLPALLLLVSILLAPERPLAGGGTVVFGCNYTLSASIDGQDFSVSHQDRVKSGSAIPFYFQDYLLQLRVTEASAEMATIELILSEKSAGGWHQIYASPPSFTVNLGVPTDFKHNDDVAEFDVSLIVSRL